MLTRATSRRVESRSFPSRSAVVANSTRLAAVTVLAAWAVLSACASSKPAPQASSSGVPLRVGNDIVVMVPDGFPPLAFDPNTMPDAPPGTKDYWSAEGSRGAITVTVWNFPNELTQESVDQLFTAWQTEMLDLYHSQLDWERSPALQDRPSHEFRSRPNADGVVTQSRFTWDRKRVLDQRYITRDAAELESDDVKAFFAGVKFPR